MRKKVNCRNIIIQSKLVGQYCIPFLDHISGLSKQDLKLLNLYFTFIIIVYLSLQVSNLPSNFLYLIDSTKTFIKKYKNQISVKEKTK